MTSVRVDEWTREQATTLAERAGMARPVFLRFLMHQFGAEAVRKALAPVGVKP